MLMIALLLFSSKTLLAQTNNDSPSTGKELKSDTTYVAVPVNLIKQANAKMIERLYLIEVNNKQEEILKEQSYYIDEQAKVITDFKQKLVDSNNNIISIQNDLDRMKKRNKIITYGATGVIVGLLFGVFIK